MDKKIQVTVSEEVRKIFDDSVSKKAVIEAALILAYKHPNMAMLFKSKQAAMLDVEIDVGHEEKPEQVTFQDEGQDKKEVNWGD